MCALARRHGHGAAEVKSRKDGVISGDIFGPVYQRGPARPVEGPATGKAEDRKRFSVDQRCAGGDLYAMTSEQPGESDGQAFRPLGNAHAVPAVHGPPLCHAPACPSTRSLGRGPNQFPEPGRSCLLSVLPVLEDRAQGGLDGGLVQMGPAEAPSASAQSMVSATPGGL